MVKEVALVGVVELHRFWEVGGITRQLSVSMERLSSSI